MTSHPFAPGAIERHTRSSTSHQRRALKRWLLITAAMLAAAPLLGLLAAIITEGLLS